MSEDKRTESLWLLSNVLGITNEQSSKVWVKIAGQVDSQAHEVEIPVGSTVSALYRLLYSSEVFDFAPGTIEYLSVGDEVRIPVVHVLTIKVASNRDLVDSDPNKTYTIHLKQAPGTFFMSPTLKRFVPKT